MNPVLVLSSVLFGAGAIGWLGWQYLSARRVAHSVWAENIKLQRDYRAALAAQAKAREERAHLVRDLQDQQQAYTIIESHLRTTQTQLAACRDQLTDAERALGVEPSGTDWFALRPGEARHSDDLARIQGIGPVYVARLRAAGIHRFADLAARTPAELAAIVQAPEWRQLDYAGWIAQATTLLQKTAPMILPSARGA